jgi:hypothetical protein
MAFGVGLGHNIAIKVYHANMHGKSLNMGQGDSVM